MYFSSIIISDFIEYAIKNGVEQSELEKNFSGLTKNKFISFEQMVDSINYLNNRLKDDFLGLHIGEQISLKVTAEVNKIMLHSQTLEESINNAIEYSKVISNALECSFKKTENHYAVVYVENPNWKVQQNFTKRQILDLTLICNLNSLAAYTDHKHYPIQINFVYDKPKKLHEYYRLFNCSLYFNQPQTEIIYYNQFFKRDSKNIQFGLLESLKEKVAEEIENMPKDNKLIYEVKKCILNSKPERITVEETASRLHMSKRTLQRKLNESKITFKKIEYELLLKLSKTYLEEKYKSIDEISYLLGFSESSAFIRFFKSHTSLTPQEYKNQN